MEEISLDRITRDAGNDAWNAADDPDCLALLATFPYRVAVATSFMEMDYAAEMLSTLVGEKGTAWEDYFHYKTDYDFGYAEYFCANEAAAPAFQRRIPEVYGVAADGGKFRTNAEAEIFDL